jgi:hypothetical protein
MNMASATATPWKSILFATTVILGVSAKGLNIRDLLIRAFTGPGSYSRIVAATLVLANLKNLPWAWHVRLPLLQTLHSS